MIAAGFLFVFIFSLGCAAEFAAEDHQRARIRFFAVATLARCADEGNCVWRDHDFFTA